MYELAYRHPITNKIKRRPFRTFAMAVQKANQLSSSIYSISLNGIVIFSTERRYAQ